MSRNSDASHGQPECPGRRACSFDRRSLLQNAATGFGWTAMAAALHRTSLGEASIGPAPKTHFPAKAKSVIFLFMDGGVSHVDSFDPKPALAKHEGEPWSGDPSRKWVKSRRSFGSMVNVVRR